jgi:hypothetical protein
MHLSLLPLLLAVLDGGAAAPTSIALPGGPPATMDYLAYEAKADRVWAPAGNTGKVDVVEVKTGKVTAIDGFPTTTVKGRDGGDRVMGPSSVSVGEGFVYVGNRGTKEVCAIEAKSLVKKGCVALSSPPDGVLYVGTTKEVWVTTPRDNSLTILSLEKPDAPKVAGRLSLSNPEGYALDEARGLFFTNQEDEDRTAVFDVKARKQVATWKPGCGEPGPRGLAYDAERRHLFVACAVGKLKTLDAAHDGAVLGEAAAGEGLDNIDYLPSRHLVYAAGGRAGTLTVVEASADGKLKPVTSRPAVEGGRVVVVDAAGTAYVADSKGGRLVVLKPQ